mmetsp:Transcript_36431/g.108151  ORF Transcript_36431/g.108151 Transcript_36431/m.108151 type:complete len:249 (-) Transcript_36431:488-1234(-)
MHIVAWPICSPGPSREASRSRITIAPRATSRSFTSSDTTWVLITTERNLVCRQQATDMATDGRTPTTSSARSWRTIVRPTVPESSGCPTSGRPTLARSSETSTTWSPRPSWTTSWPWRTSAIRSTRLRHRARPQAAQLRRAQPVSSPSPTTAQRTASALRSTTITPHGAQSRPSTRRSGATACVSPLRPRRRLRPRPRRRPPPRRLLYRTAQRSPQRKSAKRMKRAGGRIDSVRWAAPHTPQGRSARG